MNKPEFKNELIVKRCQNPEALEIHMATSRAIKWIFRQSQKFTRDKTSLIDIDQRAPAWTVILISPCFDVEEVKEYLENPIYQANPGSITILKD